MDRNSEPMERSACEFVALGLACLALWTTGVGIVTGNFYLAGAGAAVMLLMVAGFIRRERH